MAVGNIIKGGNMGGLVGYLLGSHDQSGRERERAQVIGGTMSSRSKDQLTDEFKAITDLRPRLKKNVVHQSINFPDSERELTDADLTQIGDHWAKGMGFETYAIVSHGDHIHLACSRVKLDGGVVSDSNDFKRSEKLIREIEDKFDLVRVEASHLLEPENALTHKRAITLQEIGMIEDGQQVDRFQLTNLLDQAFEEATTASKFVELLEAEGIDVRPAFDGDGKLTGFSYVVADDGAIFTSETLGRSYAYRNLLQRGLDYEPSRDRQALEQAAERSRQRQADRNAEEARFGHERDPRAVGFGIPATSGSSAKAERRSEGRDQSDQGDDFDFIEDFDAIDRADDSPARKVDQISEPIRDGGGQPETGDPASESRADGDLVDNKASEATPSDTQLPDNRGRSSANTDGPVVRKSSGRSLSSSSAAAAASLVLDTIVIDWENDPDAAGKFLRRWSAQMARINAAALKANTADSAYVPAKSQQQRYRPQYNYGRTYERITAQYGTGRHAVREKQITKQLDAMNCHRYNVTIAKDGQSYTAAMSRQQILNEQNKLAMHNARGANIHIRPAAREMADGNTRYEPLVFMNDLTSVELAKLRDAGVSLAITIRETDDKLSGWVRIGNEPVTPTELHLAAKLMEKRYGVTADLTSREGSRLAGMTNQDVKRTDGCSPFIGINTLDDLLTPATGTKFLMVEVRQRIERERLACHVPGPAPNPPTPPYAC